MGRTRRTSAPLENFLASQDTGCFGCFGGRKVAKYKPPKRAPGPPKVEEYGFASRSRQGMKSLSSLPVNMPALSPLASGMTQTCAMVPPPSAMPGVSQAPSLPTVAEELPHHVIVDSAPAGLDVLSSESMPEDRFFIPPRSAASLMDSSSTGGAASPTQGAGTEPVPARSETEAEDVEPNPPEVLVDTLTPAVHTSEQEGVEGEQPEQQEYGEEEGEEYGRNQEQAPGAEGGEAEDEEPARYHSGDQEQEEYEGEEEEHYQDEQGAEVEEGEQEGAECEAGEEECGGGGEEYEEEQHEEEQHEEEEEEEEEEEAPVPHHRRRSTLDTADLDAAAGGKLHNPQLWGTHSSAGGASAGNRTPLAAQHHAHHSTHAASSAAPSSAYGSGGGGASGPPSPYKHPRGGASGGASGGGNGSNSGSSSHYSTVEHSGASRSSQAYPPHPHGGSSYSGASFSSQQAQQHRQQAQQHRQQAQHAQQGQHHSEGPHGGHGAAAHHLHQRTMSSTGTQQHFNQTFNRTLNTSLGRTRDGQPGSPRRSFADEYSSDLRRIFYEYMNFGSSGSEAQGLDGARFAKLCRESGLLTRTLNKTRVDLIFVQVSQRARRISYRQFCMALEMVAQVRKCTVSDVRREIAQSGGPQRKGTTPINVRLHDDRTTYTGIYARGGPR